MEGATKIDGLVKREQGRQLEIQKRKENKDCLLAENEKLEYFQKAYNEERQSIANAINISDSVPANLLPDHFDNIYKNIMKLQKYVAASNIFLRVYDIQKSNQDIQELTNQAKDLEQKLLPKKKFGFKNKKQPTKNIETKENGVSKDEVDFKHVSSYAKDFCGFSNRKGEHLVLRNDELFKKDVSAQKLTDCTIVFQGNPSTLHLSNLQDCTILCGPVSTSVFVENCENCTLALACQQLRLHSSKNLKIYLHVTSKGILEDCTNVFVAPYNFNYSAIDEDYKTSGLNVSVNNWDTLDDFNWLNTKEHSPNWKVLEEEGRIENFNDFVLLKNADSLQV